MSAAGSIRVRFAPSPTGSLHVGGARTALFNWLFARKQGGAFVLRIEDTDRERSTAASEAELIESLRWLGLDWDEGPDAGGAYGPYRQSERLDLYREAAAELVAKGLAYPCFCGEKDLEARREAAAAEKQPPRYDGRCAQIAPDEAARRAQMEPHVIRFRAPQEELAVDDLLRGEVRFPAGAVGDFILVRTEGLPVYNFACVVDDAAMAITHVLRGEDHLSNTLRQVMLYRAMGMAPPRFAHLSMILGADRAKLSKRHGAQSVEHYRRQGYLPEALVNYLALLGWNPGDGRESMSRPELLAAFSLERLNKSAAVFDPEKLDWLSGLKIREAGPEALLAAARAILPDESDARLLLMLRAAIDHVRCAADLPDALEPLIAPPAVPDADTAAWLDAAELFRWLLERLESEEGPLAAPAFKAAIGEAGKTLARKGKALYMPLRVALTGRHEGPELPLLAEILGRAEVCDRLRQTLADLEELDGDRPRERHDHHVREDDEP